MFYRVLAFKTYTTCIQIQFRLFIVIVYFRNGAERSGLFCVISAVIERMKIEQDVAITQVIEQMRNNRGQIIPTQVCIQDVAITQVIEQMRNNREQIIPTQVCIQDVAITQFIEQMRNNRGQIIPTQVCVYFIL